MTTPQEAIFAMGCFWCGDAAFADHDTKINFPGVISVISGYTGGTLPNPTYENHSGHQEAVKVMFDSAIITYEALLKIFWQNIDPFDAEGQFCDKGFSYTAAIFYKDDEQRLQAEKSKQIVEQILGKKVVTEIKPATIFYEAEDYHQNFKCKSPTHYNYYRAGCRRDLRLKQIWGQHPLP